MRRICALAGYREIRTPIFEHTELFQRGVGDTTDVVQKEMYTFNDKGNRSITLKPEGTAGAARALIEAHLYAERAAREDVLCPPARVSAMKSPRRAACASSIRTAWRSSARRTRASTRRSSIWP